MAHDDMMIMKKNKHGPLLMLFGTVIIIISLFFILRYPISTVFVDTYVGSPYIGPRTYFILECPLMFICLLIIGTSMLTAGITLVATFGGGTFSAGSSSSP